MKRIGLFFLIGLFLVLAYLAPEADADAKKAKLTKHFNESIFMITDQGLFSVEIITNENEYKIGKGFFGIALHDVHDEDVENADFSIVFKPKEDTKAGNEMLEAKEKGGGLYIIKTFDLQQRGDLEVTARKGRLKDTVTFSLPAAFALKMPKGKYDRDELKALLHKK